VPDQLLGPVAALAGALVVAGVLWREHVSSDNDDRAERDRWQKVALDLLDRIPTLTSAVTKQTETIAELDRRQKRERDELVRRLGK
jgi:hypothetical protein